MTVFPIKIRLCGEEKPYTAEFQTAEQYVRAWASTLQRAHASRADIRCLCPGSGDKRLSPHRVRENERFFLARYPNTGAEHAPECIYYRADPEKSGLGSYSQGVVVETREGLKIQLAISLKRQTPNRADSIAADVPARALQSPGSRQPAMTLLGLLHLLWTESHLNTWYPGMEGKRPLGGIHHWLDQAAQPIHAGRLAIADLLLIATDVAGGAQARTNQRRAAQAASRGHRLIVVAPLASHTPEREACAKHVLYVRGYHGFPHLRIGTDLWDDRCARFESTMGAWRRGATVMLIAQIESPGRNNTTTVLDLALMRVAPRWIPVDSDFEATVEHRLHEAQRAFKKPLRFDASHDVVLPDFELLDIGKSFPMEVFGRTDESYEARRMEKAAYYRKVFSVDGWWMWDAAHHPDAIPPFPAPVPRQED
ncbi:MAG: DUF1173 family protein [Acidiferrobacterales bacterium]